MGEYRKLDYTQVALPEELLTSFAKAMLPELRKFYASDEGRTYFAKWLLKHPVHFLQNNQSFLPILQSGF